MRRSAYFQLTKAQLTLFLRNRQMLFFTMFFPLLLMIGLGTMLDGGDVALSGYVVDEDATEASAGVADTLLRVEALGLTASGDRAAALEALRHGDTQLVVVLPAGFGEALAAGGAAAEVKVFYEEQNMTVSQLGVQYVSGVVDGISKELTGYEPAAAVAAEPVDSLGLRYIDFLVPGILAMMIMSTNLNGVAGQISSWRERGVLRRMQSTTLKAGTFIAAQITARLALNGLQAVVVLLIAALVFGTRASGSWLLVLFYIVLGTLVFMSIGFIIAGVAKTPESAGPIAGLISFPLMFLGNVFFPVRNMPEFLQPVVQALPIVHLSDALRAVMNVGAGLGDLWAETLTLVVWLVAAFAVASRTFKWE
ncbi:ABC transporter permease [Paenibacillus sp.]|uniref:ABC transporter permease n=1 Tax=Paenibacillus sp. TaxID=58172 RepID=UPI002D729AAC|nr:ABC transporter permease [Paenibacillus sp.]HZG56016.1 ABC transporter permease [Paenibacillus sp.]